MSKAQIIKSSWLSFFFFFSSWSRWWACRFRKNICYQKLPDDSKWLLLLWICLHLYKWSCSHSRPRQQHSTPASFIHYVPMGHKQQMSSNTFQLHCFSAFHRRKDKSPSPTPTTFSLLRQRNFRWIGPRWVATYLWTCQNNGWPPTAVLQGGLQAWHDHSGH